MNKAAMAVAWKTAMELAATRPDYVVAPVESVMEHDGVRIVPSPEHPMQFKLDQPLIVTEVSEAFGLTSITVQPRAVMVDDIMFDLTPESNIEGFSETLVFDNGYPILIR